MCCEGVMLCDGLSHVVVMCLCVCMSTYGPHGDGGPYRGAKYDPPHESATGK